MAKVTKVAKKKTTKKKKVAKKKVAKKTTANKAVNPLITLFTSKDWWYIKPTAVNLEVCMWDYAKATMPECKYIKSKAVYVKDLEDSNGAIPMYDEYVKEAKKLGDEWYGVNLQVEMGRTYNVTQDRKLKK